jgi:hypothetical protein
MLSKIGKIHILYGIIAIFAIVAIIILVSISLNSSTVSSSSESYFYNNLDKQTVITILSKPCKITLRDYTNILNSTENLRSLSLQQITNNYVCENYDIKNEDELFSFFKSVAGECILKCLKENDIYRLALVNLKINDMIASIIPGYVIFKRALTNGVYGVEHVNVYIGNEQVSVNNIVESTLKNITPISDEDINKIIKTNNFNEKDGDLYEKYVKDFINKVQNSPPLRDNKDNNSKEFPIDVFDVVSSINIYRVFTVNSLKC